VTFDQLALGATIVFGLACAGVFAFSIAGRKGRDVWETKNLNLVALLSGLAAAGVFVFLLMQA